MDVTVIAGYYGIYVVGDGWSYSPHPDKLLQEVNEYPNGLQVIDITNSTNDPNDGRRVWLIRNCTANGLAALYNDPLSEVV